MSINSRLAIAVPILFCLSQQAAGAVLYSQPWDGGVGGLLGSQNDTNAGGFGNFAIAYDDFTLGGNATIGTVAFTGGFYDGSESPITSFTVQFYSNVSGAPGGSLYSETVTGNAGETYLATVGGDPYYSYSLPVDFAVVGGTEYWLSIVPDFGYPPQWGWAYGTGGDAISYQNFFGTLNPNFGDLGFTLSSTPLPSTWIMMLTGLAGLGFAVARLKKNTPALAAD